MQNKIIINDLKEILFSKLVIWKKFSGNSFVSCIVGKSIATVPPMLQITVKPWRFIYLAISSQYGKVAIKTIFSLGGDLKKSSPHVDKQPVVVGRFIRVSKSFSFQTSTSPDEKALLAIFDKSLA